MQCRYGLPVGRRPGEGLDSLVGPGMLPSGRDHQHRTRKVERVVCGEANLLGTARVQRP